MSLMKLHEPRESLEEDAAKQEHDEIPERPRTNDKKYNIKQT